MSLRIGESGEVGENLSAYFHLLTASFIANQQGHARVKEWGWKFPDFTDNTVQWARIEPVQLPVQLAKYRRVARTRACARGRLIVNVAPRTLSPPPEAERAVISDDAREVRLTLYAGATAIAVMPLPLQRTVTMAGELTPRHPGG